MGLWQSPKFVSFQRGYNTTAPYVDATLGLAASAHLDFINRRYYWDGQQRLERDFTTFVGATFDTGTDAGLIGTGVAANHDITLSWASLNLSEPFIMATVFRPKLLNGTTQMINNIEAASVPGSNRSQLAVSPSNLAASQTSVGGVVQSAQSSIAMTVDTNYAVATLLQTNLFRNSMNGATAGAEDLSGSLPAFSLIRLMESAAGSPYTGRIRHVLFFAQTGGAEISQADLNTLSGALSLL